MIYLLYGSDTQKSREKLNEIIEEYRKRVGSGFNVYHFDAEEDAFEKVKEAADTPSLFTPKKLVVIKYFSLSRWDRAALHDILKKIKNDPEIIMIFWDRELSAKELTELKPYCSKAQEFKLIKREVPESSVFRLGDTFFSSRREGLRSLLELLDQGHDDFNLFSYLANHARKLMVIKSFADTGRAIPASYGIHPYVAKKASQLVRSMPEENLRRGLSRFFEEDLKIKIGQSRPKESLIQMLFGR